ncbi:MAG: Sensor protein ZraS [Syntrophorhabdus sp. PtaB.Bin184]|jgi:signal transduction histidine kinase|nr:MAG: Sensor protein ZraS [Syntrophorhabdus sp. PtaB.Bin184]
MQTPEARLLENAFNEFSRASDSIISHYGVLENQIRELKRELEEKNRALERASEYLYNILDSLPVGVVVVDGRSVIFANKNAEDLIPEGIIDNLSGTAERTGEIKCGLGRYRWKTQALTNGFEGRHVVAIEDVTEIERMKEHMERDERLMAMGEMAARISHEIKNPLGSMELFLSMLMAGKMRVRDRKYVEYILFGVKTIDRIINNILSYTRPRELSLKEGELRSVVGETLEFMSVSTSVRDIDLEFAPASEGRALIDPDMLKLVVMNLVSNAMDAAGPGGRIKVDIRENERYGVLVVSDNGPGMTEELRRNIFNPFFTTKDKGVGLGLFIVYNIVKAHGGSIEVESEEGSGSSFLIYIPKERLTAI